MNKKNYTVKYYKHDVPTITTVTDTKNLKDLLNGLAKNCFMEVKINENMPVAMHNLIADHNKKTLTGTP